MGLPTGEADTPQPLAGQVAWVTGSSRGAGRAMAEVLCRLGARVAVHGTALDSPARSTPGKTMQQLASEIALSQGGETLAVWGDLTREGEVDRIVHEIRSQWGQIDILICNAGGNVGSEPAESEHSMPNHDDCLNISLEDFWTIMARNLMTAVFCCRRVAPEMMERRSGRIITIGSRGACFGHQTVATYRVAKAALHHYTRCLAHQLRPYNIPVNCVAPGPTASERFLVVWDQVHHDKIASIDAPTLERVARPRELAEFIGFLCMPSFNYMTGQVIRFEPGEQLYPC